MKTQDLTENREKMKTDRETDPWEIQIKRVKRAVLTNFKIVGLTTLKELNKKENLGRKTRNLKYQMEILKLKNTTN